MNHLFDYKFYIMYYIDLKNLSYNDACVHFLEKGISENRLFNEKLKHFDYKFYNLKGKSWFDACIHFLEKGISENRLFNEKLKHFDYEFYNLKGKSWFDACVHFLEKGISENRIFNEKLKHFDYKFYIENSTDLKELKELNGKSWFDACVHFIEFGINEGRLFNEKLKHFDYKFYIEYHTDLKEFSWFDACIHFLEKGISEKRPENIDKLCMFNENLESKYINHKINNYKFIHITKTAGTSIEEFGLKIGINWGKYEKIFYGKYKKEGFWHTPLSYIDSDIINKYNWFTIVRNPYDRIISEVNFLVKSKHLKFNKVDMNAYLHNILSEIIINETKLNKEFIEKNDIMYAFHFIPMYFYTCYDNNYDEIINNIKVLKFESLNKELNIFFKELGIEETFDIHENKNDEKIFEIYDLSIKNIKLINKIYNKDFKLFNYNINYL